MKEFIKEIEIIESIQTDTRVGSLLMLSEIIKLKNKMKELESKEEVKFTILEIRNYILSQDSFGDVAYFLSEDNIIKANDPVDDDE